MVTDANEVEPSRNWTLPVAEPPSIELTIADKVIEPAVVALMAVNVVVVVAWLTSKVVLPISVVVDPAGRPVHLKVTTPVKPSEENTERVTGML